MPARIRAALIVLAAGDVAIGAAGMPAHDAIGPVTALALDGVPGPDLGGRRYGKQPG